MKKLIPVIGGIVAAGLVVGVIAGVGRMPAGSEEAAQTSGELRWLNVVVQLPPQESPLRMMRDFPHWPDKNRFLIQIYIPRDVTPGVRPAPQMLEIDAETGEVVSDTLSPALSGQPASGDLQAVLESVRIATGPPAVWPYVDDAPPAPDPFKWGNLTFIVPDLAAGIMVSPASNTCLASAPDCVLQSLDLSNGRSQMGIRADTGQIMSLDGVLPEDRDAFERYAASVQVTASEEGGMP